MSQPKCTTSHSTRDLSTIYGFNKDIAECRARIVVKIYNQQKRGTTINKMRNIRIEDLQVRIDRLTLMRHDEIMRVYSHAKLMRNMSPSSSSVQIQPMIPRSQSPPISLEITKIDMKGNSADIDMAPILYKYNEAAIDNDIIYPQGVTDFHPYKIAARYRRAIGKSTNFRLEPLLVGDDSIETLVIGLEYFAQQHDCILSFTDVDEKFDQSIYHASCDQVDLGSIHLLATDSLLTANFQFEIDLDYDNDLAQSEDNIRKFVHDFCAAISNVLLCEISNVHVFSINKLADEARKSQVNFGLTTPQPTRTEQLAHNLQDAARSGFPIDTILRYVIPREYECTWKSVLTHLRIRPEDLDPRYNFDYRKAGVPNEDTRGSSQIWLGHINAEGEWPVAFHGTRANAVSGIVQHGLLPSAVKTDAMIGEAIDQIGEEANQPGLYVATHCNGGSDIYTDPFTVTAFPGKSERFRIVFQCRVQPGKFTTHTSPVNVGEAWRIIDPTAVRPYGILLKKEDSIEREEET